MIRAFNADLPYDRFVVEQIAGDLLERPRRHPVERLQRVDPRRPASSSSARGPIRRSTSARTRSARIDNQIDVLSKTFLGLTVACARCHDHKFDPITHRRTITPWPATSSSSRHQHAFIDPPERIAARVARARGAQDGDAAAHRGVRTGIAGRDVAASEAAAGARPVASDESLVFEDFDAAGLTTAGTVTGDAFGDRPDPAGRLR